MTAKRNILIELKSKADLVEGQEWEKLKRQFKMMVQAGGFEVVRIEKK